MQRAQFQQLSLALSAERLAAYRLDSRNQEAEVIARYLWNVALGESLYPSLQCLEVALRNSLHDSLSQALGGPFWFDNIPHILRGRELARIEEAKATLRRERKPLEPGRIVAELSFGFWTSLLDLHYEQTLWPQLLRPAFPSMPRRIRTRRNLSARFNKIRRLRNRIFHHEPIWRWADLPQHHADLLEALGWLSPALRDLVQGMDRFPETHTAGVAPHLERWS